MLNKEVAEHVSQNKWDDLVSILDKVQEYVSAHNMQAGEESKEESKAVFATSFMVCNLFIHPGSYQEICEDPDRVNRLLEIASFFVKGNKFRVV